MLYHGPVKTVKVGTCAKRLLAGRLQDHECDVGISRPRRKALEEQVDHFQRQGIQRLLGVQARDACACAVVRSPFFEQYRMGPGIGHATFNPDTERGWLTRRITKERRSYTKESERNWTSSSVGVDDIGAIRRVHEPDRYPVPGHFLTSCASCFL